MENRSKIQIAPRRYDLDRLRVFAFGLLIFYHIGMLYVEHWGFHFKSAYTSAFLENIMLLAGPWRLALLWMVSGIATSYLLDKFRWWEFLRSRSVRLLLPLAFGVWVIVPPQLFVEMSSNGDFSGTYLEFYRAFFDLRSPIFDGYSAGIWPHVDVNHLWYLRELWTFTLLLMIVLPLLNWLRESRLFSRVLLPFGSMSLLVSVPLLLISLDIAISPHLGSDGRRQLLGISFFVLGYLLTHQESVWEALRRCWRVAIILALVAYGALLATYHFMWLPSAGELTPMQASSMVVAEHMTRWFCLCAMFGYAFEHLNRPARWLDYLSPGVYTFYLVHQTLILLLAFYLAPMSLGPVLEPILIIVATFGGCLLIYESVRRATILQPLFGMKTRYTGASTGEPLLWWKYLRGGIVALIVLPLGFEILL